MTETLDPALARDIERAAVDLARLAGAEIVAALERGGLAVSYKGGDGVSGGSPVSDIDQRVEALIRAEIARRKIQMLRLTQAHGEPLAAS